MFSGVGLGSGVTGKLGRAWVVGEKLGLWDSIQWGAGILLYTILLLTLRRSQLLAKGFIWGLNLLEVENFNRSNQLFSSYICRW